MISKKCKPKSNFSMLYDFISLLQYIWEQLTMHTTRGREETLSIYYMTCTKKLPFLRRNNESQLYTAVA